MEISNRTLGELQVLSLGGNSDAPETYNSALIRGSLDSYGSPFS